MSYPYVTIYHCDFCSKTFESGRLLNHHLGDDHPEVVNAILDALPKEKESTMLPNAGTPKQGTRQGSTGGGAGFPFLNQTHLSTEQKDATIIDVKNEPNHRFGPSVVVKLEMEHKTYLWTLHINNNPNFGILLKKFGKDEAKWKDQKIFLVLEEDEFSGQLNIRTHFPKSGK